MIPFVSVGILSDKNIELIFNTNYSCFGKNASGKQSVAYSGGHIYWNGERYKELYFENETDEASFTIKNVVIGVNFHWERKEDQIFQGNLKLIVENEKITAINIINVENYLISVISSEMSPTASLELLKAHAVISRSWLLAQIEKNRNIAEGQTHYSAFIETQDEIIRWYDREDHTNFDVCADDHCQRYQGITRASVNIDTVKQAVNNTGGQVLEYDGKICDARFYKCCGGVTEEFQNCWEDIQYPYLSVLRDNENSNNIPDLTQEKNAIDWIKNRAEAFCDTTDKKILGQVLNNYDQETKDFYRWQITYSQQKLSELVYKRSGIDFGTIEELIPIQRGTSGRIIRLKIIGSKKTLTIGKELEIRRILSTSHLYSSAFIVEKKDDDFILTGAGWGHGVGLCQIGAAVMGEKGYLYNQILLHYYRGATLKKLY